MCSRTVIVRRDPGLHSRRLVLAVHYELFIFRLGVGRHEVPGPDIGLLELCAFADLGRRRDNAVFQLGIVAHNDAVHKHRAHNPRTLANHAVAAKDRVLNRRTLVDLRACANEAVGRQLRTGMDGTLVLLGRLERHRAAPQGRRHGEWRSEPGLHGLGARELEQEAVALQERRHGIGARDEPFVRRRCAELLRLENLRGRPRALRLRAQPRYEHLTAGLERRAQGVHIRHAGPRRQGAVGAARSIEAPAGLSAQTRLPAALDDERHELLSDVVQLGMRFEQGQQGREMQRIHVRVQERGRYAQVGVLPQQAHAQLQVG